MEYLRVDYDPKTNLNLMWHIVADNILDAI